MNISLFYKNQALQKGFTIIELIVVIAIIAVLATIVLVNVTKYINTSKDAAIKGNMDTILVNSADYYNTNSNYTSFNTSILFTGPQTAITNAGKTATIDNLAAGFCVHVPLYAGGSDYCIDSTGFKGVLAGGKCTGATVTCN